MVPTPTNLTGSKFKNERGILLTRSLFFETSLKPDLAIYTLKNHDHTFEGKDYPSLFLLYLSEMDPIEYTFATKHLDSWTHWESLTKASWFQPHIKQWRHELEMKIKSEALANIILESHDKKSPSRSASNKYLLEKGWEPKDKNTKGRPTKDDIKEAAYTLAEIDRRVEEDYNRLQPTKVN